MLNIESTRWSSSFINQKPVFYIGGNAIKIVNQWPHLGHIIDNRSDNGAHISLNGVGLIHWWARLKTFVLLSHVGALPKLKLIKSYCSSLYGCELWNLFYSAISDVRIAWSKVLRRVWSLPYNTHTAPLAPLSDSIPLMDEIICQRILFFTVDCLIANII